MRFHLPALPGQPLTRDNSHCAYTQKVLKFANMMSERGHEVIVYAGEECDAACSEHVRAYRMLDGDPPPFEQDDPRWAMANAVVAYEASERQQPGDILCVIAGVCQKLLADRLPGMHAVEFGVGYSGTFANWRVFESQVWRHVVVAAIVKDANAIGRFEDTVIPNYFDPDDFPVGGGGSGNLVYLGRMIENKGLKIAEEVARRADMSIVYAGNEGDYMPEYGTWIGPVGPDDRARLLGSAKALICPTLYLEPFGGVAVEAQMCGTPVLATPWGAFVETVEQGVTGYLGDVEELVAGAKCCGNLDRRYIRERAIKHYSLDAIAPMYERYFERVLRG